MTPTPPRVLYLHGFASGPDSAKGRGVAAHLAARGVPVARLDLRVPSFERLRHSVMIDVVRAAIGGERDRAVVFGSSLGGLTAARVAQVDPRVCGLVLLAPALGVLDRWRDALGPAAWRAWEATGWREVDDHVTRQKGRVDFGFARDLEAVEAAYGAEPDVRVPTLVIHGRHDDVVDPARSRAWAAARPWVRHVEVDDGHELTASLPTILAESDAFLRPYFGG